MNDFTKQDLIHLHDLCHGCIHDDHPVEDWMLSLRVKIKSMIKNYCEHKNIVTGAYPRSNPPKKCDSCGVLYYVDQ